MEKTDCFNISDVSRILREAVETVFPRKIWVVGEIQGLDRNRHGKHWYFSLSETMESGETYRLPATIWRGMREKLFGPRGRCAGVFDLSAPLDGTKIMALCQVDFYQPLGRVSLIVNDINPEFTLGDIEARRQALLEKLKKEGLLTRNQERPMPEVPFRIGLITSLGSAAYNDFMNELESSGYGFQVLACDARMQGEDSLLTVPRAFRSLEKLDPDVIVLIRGGGSRLDLSWFDREETVMAVVNSSVPVITGIGHEIDTTLCQAVAGVGLKTPTAAAAFVKERPRLFLDHLAGIAAKIAAGSAETMRCGEEAVGLALEKIRSSSLIAGLKAGSFFRETVRQLSSLSLLRLGAEAGRVDLLRSRFAAGRPTAILGEHGLDLSRLPAMLQKAAASRMEKARHTLDLLGEKCRLLDPAAVVSRGYAVVRNESGVVIKDVKSTKAGEILSVLMRDGTLKADVKEIIEEVNHGEEEARQLEIW